MKVNELISPVYPNLVELHFLYVSSDANCQPLKTLYNLRAPTSESVFK